MTRTQHPALTDRFDAVLASIDDALGMVTGSQAAVDQTQAGLTHLEADIVTALTETGQPTPGPGLSRRRYRGPYNGPRPTGPGRR